jgi:putative phage-type endonuclease
MSEIKDCLDMLSNFNIEIPSDLMRVISELSTIESEEEDREPFVDSIDDEDIIEITNTVYETCDEYLHNNILTLYEANYHDKMIKEITDYIFEDWFSAGLCVDVECDDSQTDYKDVTKLITNIINDYFEISKEWKDKIPKRVSEHYKTLVDIPKIQSTIDLLRQLPQPEQRTSEWYEFRHNLITASNLGKVFGSEASVNSLIYEKCCPHKTNDNENGYSYVNTLSPMHWGQKYEPVSVMLYEKRFHTKVDDFGCIQHRDHKFIGASPDGIITDPHSERYGRMLEIKNIVNREIDGNPLKAYWIQMQIQLETCDLEYCDFLETRIKEYEKEEEFYNDTKERGVILHFVEKITISSDNGEISPSYSGQPNYIYMPLDNNLDKESIDKWIGEKKTELSEKLSLYSTIYWYLDQFSCVLVERNRKWFQAVVPKIEETWNTILIERESGYEHRAAKKKVVKVPGLEITQTGDQDSRTIHNLPVLGGVCLVKLDYDE